jgi:hypothetical protein
MPEVYEKIDFQFRTPQVWNFDTYPPSVISIALGTNDFSNGDGVKKRLPFDSAAFVASYIKFIKMVKSKHPDAQIALLSSAMVGGNNKIRLENCIKAVKENVDFLYPSKKPVATYFFRPMQPHGCTGHPSVEDHAILANELIPFFKNFL